MATVRHKVMKEAEVDPSRKGEVIKKTYPADILKSKIKVKEVVEELKKKKDIRTEYHVRDYRPWGSYQIMEEEKNCRAACRAPAPIFSA